MQIGRIYYPVKVLGPGNRIGIWTAGCNKSCPGCISPEWQPADSGRQMAIPDILGMVEQIYKKYGREVSGFTISGGEPFLNPAKLGDLLEGLSRYSKDIICFTGFSYEELKEQKEYQKALSYLGVLIDGPFIKDKMADRGLKGSENQRIIILKETEGYRELLDCKRFLQNIRVKDGLITLGIPGNHKL